MRKFKDKYNLVKSLVLLLHFNLLFAITLPFIIENHIKLQAPRCVHCELEFWLIKSLEAMYDNFW